MLLCPYTFCSIHFAPSNLFFWANFAEKNAFDGVKYVLRKVGTREHASSEKVVSKD